MQSVTGSEENAVLVHVKAMEFLGAFFRVDLAGDALDGVTLRADLAVDLVRRLDLAEGQSLPVAAPAAATPRLPGSVGPRRTGGAVKWPPKRVGKRSLAGATVLSEDRSGWRSPARPGRGRCRPGRNRRVTTVIRTVCAHDCPDMCSILAHVEDGRLTRVEGDPDQPFTAGFVCAKVRREPEMVHSPGARARRRCGAPGPRASGRFAPVSWDEALDEIVERWQAIIREDGPLAILGYCYSAHQGQLNRGLLMALFHALGTTRLQPGTVCDTCADVAWEATCGPVGGADPEAMLDSDLSSPGAPT